jgi:hypothetical protein
MDFEDQAAYDRYNDDPVHLMFVGERWHREVQHYQEIDYLVGEDYIARGE